MTLDNTSPPSAQRKHRAFTEENHEQQGSRAESSPFSPPSSARKCSKFLILRRPAVGPGQGMTPSLTRNRARLENVCARFDSEMLEGFVSAISDIHRFVTHSFPLFVSQNLQSVRAQRTLAHSPAFCSALTRQWISVPYVNSGTRAWSIVPCHCSPCFPVCATRCLPVQGKDYIFYCHVFISKVSIYNPMGLNLVQRNIRFIEEEQIHA